MCKNVRSEESSSPLPRHSSSYPSFRAWKAGRHCGERRIQFSLTPSFRAGKVRRQVGSEESSSPLPRHSERGRCAGKWGAKNLVNRRGACLRMTIRVRITRSFVRAFYRTTATLDDGFKKEGALDDGFKRGETFQNRLPICFHFPGIRTKLFISFVVLVRIVKFER